MMSRKDILCSSKICFGPMSKNIVDSIIKLSNDEKISFTLIPSRRQIEYNGGYVNNWTTKEFSEYVYNNSQLIAIQRDHSGPGQGLLDDDGYKSLYYDCLYFDSIHIDPWKKYQNIDEGIQYTIELINYCYKINNNIYFEIGTEEAIRKFEFEDLEYFLIKIKEKLDAHIFNRIIFCVLQSGTALGNGINKGLYDSNKLCKMIDLIKSFNLLTKEHNGDFMESAIKIDRFDKGLDSLNIAPELGTLETKIIMNNIDKKYFEDIFNICLKSNKWVKWVDKDFIPENNKQLIIDVSCHYIFSNEEFKKLKYSIEKIDTLIEENIISFINNILK